ncbi:MAG TPA: hypothetical protein VGH38_30530 [Bryobacteraceae bacterium]|jgi:hypothetical protein
MESSNFRYIALGARIGRGQAFGLVANQSMAAQARVLKELRDSADYKQTGLTWDVFCPQCLGLSRPRIDAIIDNYEQYGDEYFRLSEIVKISPEAYRQIAPKIAGEAIEIDGEMVPLVPENAARIRTAVHQMRGQIAIAKAKNPIATIHTRLEGCVVQLIRLSGGAMEPADKVALRGIVEDSVLRLMEISERLAA